MKQLASIAPKLNPLVADYLSGKKELAMFTAYAPTLDGLRSAHQDRVQTPIDRTTLVDALIKQAGKSAYSTDHTIDQIKAISRDEVVTITTGHQLCLYGGPLFFLYKILSTIKLRDQLKDVGIQAVPVYWMASEDHDFEEINHVFLGQEKIAWPNTQGGAVGRMALENLEQFKHQVAEHFQKDYRYGETLETLSSIFNADRTLSQAIRDFVYWVFSEHGVVVIDADDRSLKQTFAPILKKELSNGFSAQALTNQSEQLINLGYSTQVSGREINLFWLDEHYRERILRTDGAFATADGAFTWSERELLTLVEDRPECFSPNVILRPLYQECILPNIAYIGGPGETSYWLQLKGVFDEVGVKLPVILLRDMFSIVEQSVEKKRNQLGLSFAALNSDRDSIIRSLMDKLGSHEHLARETSAAIQREFELLFKELGALDPTLVESAKAEEARIVKRLSKFEKKIYRADKRRSETSIERLDTIRVGLFPQNAPQERVHNWLNYFPVPHHVDGLLPFCNPLDPHVKYVGLDY